MADVKLQAVAKAYGDTKILHGIDLEIRDGEFMVFVGPSGCGKSTLLRTIAGLEDISSGEMRIGGVLVNEVPPAERGIAMVFQSYALYPHMNLFDNMAFGLKLARVSKQEIANAVHHAAKILHIEHLLDRKPKDLSGGQRQRVAIGRAIVRKPEVFLFDEPLSNLDAALRVRMRYEFAKLHEELKTTMVYVTHDQVEAMTLADRIAVLQAGRLEQVGTPLELYEHPRNLFVAGFIGSPKMNLLDCELLPPPAGEAAADGVAWLKLADGAQMQARVDARGLQPGARLTLGIRPEHIRRASSDAASGNLLHSSVAFVESLGGTTFAYCPYPGLEDPLTCQFEGRNGADRLRAGEPLSLYLPPEALYLFDEQGLALRRLAAPELAA